MTDSWMHGLKIVTARIMEGAVRDLQHPCAKIRRDAIDYFKEPTWVQLLGLHPDFVKRRMAARVRMAAKIKHCKTGSRNADGELRCLNYDCRQLVVKDDERLAS